MNTVSIKGAINDILSKLIVSSLFRGFEFSYRYLKLILVMNFLFLYIDFPNIDKHLINTFSICLYLFILSEIEYYLAKHYLDVEKKMTRK